MKFLPGSRIETVIEGVQHYGFTGSAYGFGKCCVLYHVTVDNGVRYIVEEHRLVGLCDSSTIDNFVVVRPEWFK